MMHPHLQHLRLVWRWVVLDLISALETADIALMSTADTIVHVTLINSTFSNVGELYPLVREQWDIRIVLIKASHLESLY